MGGGSGQGVTLGRLSVERGRKPKLVFVQVLLIDELSLVIILPTQACQGKETDAGSNVTERDRRRRHTSQDSNSTYKISNYADFLIFQVD